MTMVLLRLSFSFSLVDSRALLFYKKVLRATINDRKVRLHRLAVVVSDRAKYGAYSCKKKKLDITHTQIHINGCFAR